MLDIQSDSLQPRPNENIAGAVNRLKLLSPIRMRRIGAIRKERTELLDVLRRDDTEHFLGSDRFHRIMDFRGTEGRIVREVMDGFTGETLVTRGLWSKVLLKIGESVDIGRRTQIFADLYDASEQTRDPLKRKAIDELLRQFETIDPGIRKRSAEEGFFESQVIDAELAVIEDTFRNLF